MIARAAGRDALRVRRPHVRVIDVPANDGRSVSAELIAASARTAGARVTLTNASARDAASIASAIGDDTGDLTLLVGGSGVGRGDAAVTALAARGEVLAHGLALRPDARRRSDGSARRPSSSFRARRRTRSPCGAPSSSRCWTG